GYVPTGCDSSRTLCPTTWRRTPTTPGGGVFCNGARAVLTRDTSISTGISPTRASAPKCSHLFWALPTDTSSSRAIYAWITTRQPLSSSFGITSSDSLLLQQPTAAFCEPRPSRSEEHTSELQSRENL